MRRNWILTLIGACIFHVSFSQSDNYWAWNFNTPSVLLAGSVVGGGAGSSAIFYNPSLIDNGSVPSLTVTASLLSLQFFKGENMFGENLDVDEFIFKIQPRFVSYLFPTKNEKIGVIVAVLSPVSDEIKFTTQHFDVLDLIQRTEGVETYSGYLNYLRKYNDIFIGSGMSYAINDNFNIGASSFFSIKTMEYRYHELTQAYQEGDYVIVNNDLEPKYIAESSSKEELKYWNLSLVFKLGAQYKSKNEKFSIGINATLPNIRIAGNGDVRQSFGRSNIYNNQEDAFTSNENTISYEEEVKSTVKSPFSLALGAQYLTDNKKSFISVTAEYFHNIDSYAVIESNYKTTFNNNLESLNAVVPYYFAAKSVTNFGIGIKKYISPSLMILGGFRTDFSVVANDGLNLNNDQLKINKIHVDKYHFSAGNKIKFKKVEIVSGIQFTHGSNEKKLQIVNFSDPIEYNSINNESLVGIRQSNMNVSVNEIALFLGVIMGL